jgi:hypothetical protein
MLTAQSDPVELYQQLCNKMTAKLNTAFHKGLDQIHVKGSDTPRTDAAQLWHFDEPVVPKGFACELEAEVEFWKAKTYEAEQSEGKHEAEVERLKGIVKAQQDELEEIFFALGTNEGHSLVDQILTLTAEVERLRAMVIEAAHLGDARASNFKDRAEKAESLLTQIQAFTEALNPKIK